MRLPSLLGWGVLAGMALFLALTVGVTFALHGRWWGLFGLLAAAVGFTIGLAAEFVRIIRRHG